MKSASHASPWSASQSAKTRLGKSSPGRARISRYSASRSVMGRPPVRFHPAAGLAELPVALLRGRVGPHDGHLGPAGVVGRVLGLGLGDVLFVRPGRLLQEVLYVLGLDEAGEQPPLQLQKDHATALVRLDQLPPPHNLLL